MHPAVTAYLEAYNKYWDIRDDYDMPEHFKHLRALLADMQVCLQNLLAVAEPGDPEIWHTIGKAYRSGMGTKRDRAAAIQWFQKAAEAGYYPAMVQLGQCLSMPEPAIDRAGAIQWYRRAAAVGDASAMVWLGFAYREGSGVPQDYQLAVDWFIKAVAAGDIHATLHVGRMYAHYLSRPTEAVSWLLRAAQALRADSFLELARLYDNKELEVYNSAEAHKWFRVAADYSEGKSVSALFALARQHLDGQGAACDLEKARFWLRRILAVAPPSYSSHREATKLLQKLDGQFL